MTNQWPQFEPKDGLCTMTWQDQTHIDMEHPRVERQTYVAFTSAYGPSGGLVGEGPLRMFETTDVVRYALRCSASNGATAIDWNSRLICMAHAVRHYLMEQAKAAPPEPLRRALPEAGPYPITDLGAILAPMVEALQESIQAPDAICGQSVLAGATLAVQAYANVLIDGRRFPVSAYYLDIGESGERRSAVDRCALYPHYTHEHSLHDAHKTAHQEYENDFAAWKRSREEILKGKGTRDERRDRLNWLGPPPAAPFDPVMIVEEPTYEGLIKQFVRGQRSLGLFSDEGGRFLGGHGMNADNNLKTITGLSELWDGKRVTRVRATDETVILYGRRLAMHLMVQPVIAQAVLSDTLLQGQGLLNRCLVCWPTSTAGSRPYKEHDLASDQRAQRYNARIQECLQGEPPHHADHPDELAPRDLPFTAPAKRLWILYHDEIERDLGAGHPLHTIRGFGNKTAEHAARLAAVLMLIQDHEAQEIDIHALAAGVELMRFYVHEALRLYRAEATHPDILLAEELLIHLTGKSLVALPDIYQRGPSMLREAKTARRIVTILEEHGWLVRIPGHTEVDGVMRREAWEVRPWGC